MGHNWLIKDPTSNLRIVAWVHVHMQCFDMKISDENKKLLFMIRLICAKWRLRGGDV